MDGAVPRWGMNINGSSCDEALRVVHTASAVELTSSSNIAWRW